MLPVPVAAPPHQRELSRQRSLQRATISASCTICHNGPVNPDLLRSKLLKEKAAWQTVVIDGALSPNGMASFAPYLKREESEGIRAYLNQEAKALLQAEGSR